MSETSPLITAVLLVITGVLLVGIVVMARADLKKARTVIKETNRRGNE